MPPVGYKHSIEARARISAALVGNTNGITAGHTHGHASRSHRSGTYRSWEAMKRRVASCRDIRYERYGGRGVVIDPRWLSFEAFLADMGERPEGKTLDRIDNDGDYTPDNVRWATAKEQRNNQTSAARAK